MALLPPFYPLSGQVRRILLWAGGLVCFLAVIAMARVQRPLTLLTPPVPAFQLQRAGTPEAANAILKAWHEYLPAAKAGVYWDFLLIGCYAVFLSLLSAPGVQERQFAEGSRMSRFAGLFAWLPLLAGLADVLEDIGLLAMLNAPATTVQWAHPTTILSTIKFVLLGISLVWIPFAHGSRVPGGLLIALGRCVMWLFLLRVPLLVTLAMAVLPSFYLFDFGPKDMVAGAFDAGKWQFWFVGLLLGLLGASVVMNARLVLLYGSRRYRLPGGAPISHLDGTEILQFIVALAALPTACACLDLFSTGTSLTGLLFYGLSGLAGAYVALFITFQLGVEKTKGFWEKRAEETTGLQGLINRWYAWLGEGYCMRKEDGREVTLRGHLMSAAFGTVAWLIYIGIQFIPSALMPAIVYVLLLLMALCWTLSTLTFWLDRYRVPLIFALGFWLWIIGFSPRSEYYFEAVHTVPLQTSTVPPPAAAATLPTAESLLRQSMLRISEGGSSKDRFPIFVTAQGGGIHAGSWATEVLTGLEQLSRERKAKSSFSKNVRAVSGVSGGSYGLLYFADAYENGELRHETFAPDDKRLGPDVSIGGQKPTDTLGLIRALAMRDSLSSVVKGLVYRDVWNDFFALGIGQDRATRMERRWTEGTDLSFKDGKAVTLNDWVKDAVELKRPAVFFNSTCVETGRPVVFGTSWVRDWMFEDAGDARQLATVPVVTGARLSAAFPLISAAARPKFTKSLPIQPLHYVDGGFYDNYGIVSLSHWMEDGLLGIYGQDISSKDAGPPIPGRLLVIQIRYKSPQTPKEAEAKNRGNGLLGGLFQEAAPLLTLANVRSAAQTLRNSEEFDVFTRYWGERGVQIQNAAFDFTLDAPLSWHLTEKEKETLENERKKMLSQYQSYSDGVTQYEREVRELEAQIKAAQPPGTASSGKTEELRKQQAAVLQKWDDLKKDMPLGAAAWEVMKYLDN